MAAKIIILLLVAIATVASGDKTFFKDCGSTTGKLIAFDVTPCPQEPCIFKKNTTVSITIKFSSAVNTTKVTAAVTGLIDRVPVPFPIPVTDGCTCSVQCPVKAGDSNTYKYGLGVKSSYPSLKLIVKYELKDDNNKDLVCAEFPASISD